MTIKIKEGSLPAVTEEFKDALMNAAMEASREASKLVSDEAFKHASKAANDLLTKFKAELAGINTPKILSVEVSGVENKLTANASPYLGRLIVNSKIGLNTLLVGPAGAGKTFLAKQLAEALDYQFASVCLTAGASETWLFGRQTPKGFVEGNFSKFYREGGVFLADEMDAADANLLLAINTALANGHFYNPINGETYDRHPSFVFVGAANTFGKGADQVFTGRSRLDGATLDRFIILQMDYNESVEKALCPNEPLRLMLVSIREKLKSLNAVEFVSTRAMDFAYKQYSNGIDVDDIVSSIVASWPESIRKDVEKFVTGKLKSEIKKAQP